MVFVSGEIISLLTFPGVIVHEWAHKICCNIVGVKVFEVKYFQLNSEVAGYVNHEPPSSFRQAFLIAIGPLLINTLLAFVLGIISTIASGIVDSLLFALVMIWLSVSIGVHAFPSNQDAKSIIQAASEKRKKGITLLLLLAYPFVWFLFVINMLRVIWFDFVFGLFVVGFGVWLGERILEVINSNA